MRSVVVTGGAGYIGSHVCSLLETSGYVPVCVDNFTTGQRVNARFGPVRHLDVLDEDGLVLVLQEFEPLAVIHLAALCNAGESGDHEVAYHRVNVAGTSSLLSAMNRTRTQNLIFSSTCAVYGNLMKSPVVETAPIDLINVYARTKWLAEQAIVDASAATDLRAVVFRFFNAAGSYPERGLGERVRASSTLVPAMMRVLQGHAQELTINGDDYPTSDGTCVRDYLHVRDIAAAHLLALNQIGRFSGVEYFNLGSQCGVSVRQMVAAAERITGMRMPLLTGPRREGDPVSLWSDSSKANQLLGWRPQHSQLDEVVGSTWTWALQSRGMLSE